MSQLATPPYVLQANTVSHGAQLFRNAVSLGFGPGGGIGYPQDLSVTQNGTPNMSVNVAAGQVLVPGSQGGTFPSGAEIQGLYYSEATATTNLAIAAANATNPRLDQIIAQVQDAAYAGSANSCQLAVITGTPTAAAALNNLVGLGTFPPTNSSALLLAYVLVPANATSIITVDIGNVASVASHASGAWQPFTLLNGATAPSGYYALSYRLEGDLVRLKGGVTVTSNSTFAALPSGYRPSDQLTFACNAQGAYNVLTVNTGGNIVTATNNTTFAVDGIAFTLS